MILPEVTTPIGTLDGLSMKPVNEWGSTVIGNRKWQKRVNPKTTVQLATVNLRGVTETRT